MAGQRMIEIEQRRPLVDLLEHPGVAPAIGRRKVDQIADLPGGTRLGVLGKHGSGEPLHQRGVTRAEGCIGRQVETGMRALGQTEQALFERLSQLAEPHLQGRRRATKRTNDITAAIGQTDAVMQREMGVSGDENRRVIHGWTVF